jgi:hypothetical protein
VNSSRPLYIPTGGFYAATPGYDDAGDVHIVLTKIVAFTPLYEDGDTDDFISVEPLVENWDGVEHPGQLIKRPDGLYVDRFGRIGDKAAALRLSEQ